MATVRSGRARAIGALLAVLLVSPLTIPSASAQTSAAPPAIPGALPESYPWMRLAENLTPAVVNVRTTGEPARGPEMLPEQFRRPQPPEGRPQPPEGRERTPERPRPMRGMGSGFVIDPTGYIVTNHHVVDSAKAIEVTLNDGRKLPAKLVGSDPETDIALIKVEATGLPAIALGSSGALRVAEPVMAIGNPFGLDHTVTVGIISGTGRVIGAGRYDDFLQTDAAINPGNSGGPLINTRGEAVGIATAIASRSGGFQGVGFAIPIDLAKPIVQQLRAAGKVTRGWLGVSIQPLTPELAKSFGVTETKGALVASVQDGSPAERAGVKPGDVIVRYDGKPVDSPRALPGLVANTEIGKAVDLGVVRDGSVRSLKVTVGNMAEARQASAAGGRATASRVADRMGVELQQADKGVVVTDVKPESPADQAGLAEGDIIREVNRTRVERMEDLEKAVSADSGNGKQLLLRVERAGSERYVVVDVS